jgi:hypothetical protein
MLEATGWVHKNVINIHLYHFGQFSDGLEFPLEGNVVKKVYPLSTHLLKIHHKVFTTESIM